MANPSNLIKHFYEATKDIKHADLAHPSDDELSLFVTGLADERLRVLIEQHIAECYYCLNLIAERKRLLLLAEEAEPETFVQRAKEEIRSLVDTHKIFEIVFGLADRITKIIKTTGQPYIGVLAPARGAAPSVFDTNCVVTQTFGSYRAGISLERKHNVQSLAVFLRHSEAGLIEGAEIVLRNGREQRGVTHRGEVSFSDLPKDRYIVTIQDAKREVGTVILELRDLTGRECLDEARSAIARSAYSQAEDLLASAFQYEENEEALALAAITQQMKAIDPEGFQDDLATRSPSVLQDRIIDRRIQDLDSLVQRIQDYNPLLVEALKGIGYLHRREFDKALPIFQGLTQKLDHSPFGFAGVGLTIESREDIDKLSAEKLDEAIHNLEKAVSLHQENQPVRELYELALKAKVERLEQAKVTGVLHEAIKQMGRDLTLLVERTGESLHKRLDSLEGKMTVLSGKLDELAQQYAVSQPQGVSEIELHELSNGYSKAIVERVENYKALLGDEYRTTEAWLLEQVGGKHRLDNLGQSRIFLLTGEFVYRVLKQANAADFSPASLGYVKALETLLNEKIIWNVEAWLGCRTGDKRCIQEKLKSDFEMRDTLNLNMKILQDKRGRFVLAGEYTLSCGEMAEMFAEMKANTAGWEVYRRLTDFLAVKTDRLLAEQFQDALRRISTEFRNGAVHSESLSLESCEDCRSLVIAEITSLLTAFD